MNNKLRILHLEDLFSDAELISKALKKGLFDFERLVVDTKAEFINALAEFSPDIILVDHALPSFNSHEALLLFHETGMKIPFILVTAAMSDEFAVDIMKKGADDYILKDRLGRLPGAIRNALAKFELEKKSKCLLEELKYNERHYRALVENGSDAVVILDPKGKPNYVSPSIKKILGYTEFEALKLDLHKVVHPDDMEGVIQRIDDCIRKPGIPIEGNVNRIKHKDGSWVWVEATVTNMLHDPAINGIVTNFRDITFRKLAEEKIIHANKLYAFISEVNQTIVHSQNEQTVFAKVCRIAIEIGKFKAAWIGMIDHAKNEINLVEGSGLLPDDLARFRDASCDIDGPQHHVLRNDSYYACNNVKDGQELNNWKLFAIDRGYNSIIVLPIRKSGMIVGTFNLYSSKEDFFNDSEIALLEEATADISFSLEVFEKEKLRTQAENKLIHNQAALKQAQAIAHVGSWELDFETGNSTWSEEMLRIYGLPIEEADQSYASWLSYIHPDDIPYVLTTIKDAEANQADHAFFYRIIRPDGNVRHLYSQSKIQFDNAGRAIGMYGVAHDVTKTKVAEEALRQSEVFNKGVLSSLSAQIAVIDEVGNIIAVNKAWDDFSLDNGLHSVQSTSTGSNYFDVCKKSLAMGDLNAGRAMEGILAVLKKEKQSFDMEYSCHSPHKQRWMILHVKSLGIDNSKVVISHQNITEIKESQEALRNSQSNLQAIFKNSSEGFILTDLHGILKACNDMATEFVWRNTSKKISIGASIFDFIEVSGKENLKTNISKALSGETISYDHHFEIENGNTAWFNFIITPVKNEEVVAGVCITIADITERKKTEVSLKKSEFRYRQIVETAQEGIWVMDENNITTFANKKLCDILEYSIEEIQGKTNYFFMDENGKQAALEALGRRKMGVKETMDLNYITKSGRHIKTKVSANPIFDEDDEYEGTLAMVSDVTEQAMVAEMLQESEQRYREIAYEMQLESARLIEAQAVAKVGSWELDLHTMKTTWSDEMYRIYETDSRRFQVTQEAVQHFIHPADRKNVDLSFQNSIVSKASGSVEHRITTATGGVKHLIEHWKFFLNEKEQPVRAMGTCQDITQNIVAQEKTRFKANLLKTIGQAVIATDLSGVVNYWNNAAEKIYGWTAAEAIGKNIMSLTPANQTKEHANEIVEQLKLGKSWTGEFTVKRKNGAEFPVYVTDSPIYNKENELIGIIGISSDITEKKELEQLLDKANNLARLGSWEVDLLKQTLYWSAVTRQIHEVENDFVADLKTAIDFYKAGSSRESINDAIKSAMENGTPWALELEVVTAKGNERWVRTLGEALFVNGECIKLTGSFQDIDVRKRAEIEVSKVSEEKNVILESIGDGFYALDKNWTIIYWNKGAETLLHKKRTEVLGKNLWTEYPDLINSTFYINYHKAVEQNKSHQFEEHYELFDLWVEVSIYPSQHGLSVFFKDITPRKQSENVLLKLNESLESYTKELVVSNKGLEQFSYIVSHNLRAPVANIIGLTELLKDSAHTEEMKETLNTELGLCVKKLDTVIVDLNQILQVKEQITEKKEVVDLSELVEDIQSSIQNLIRQENVVIETDFSQLKSFTTLRSYLHSIFYNLISNSIKYRQENIAPLIHIRTIKTEAGLIIIFSDNGSGIDLEKRGDQVFGLYKRFHKNIEGKGMGLFMVKTQVEILGGKIAISSDVNKGTEFRIEFKLDLV